MISLMKTCNEKLLVLLLQNFSFAEVFTTSIIPRQTINSRGEEVPQNLMYCLRYCIIQATTTSQISLTSLSDSNFKSRLPDSTVNWDSRKMELGPRGIVSQNSKKQEGQSLQPEMLLTRLFHNQLLGESICRSKHPFLFRLILFTERRHVGRNHKELIRS